MKYPKKITVKVLKKHIDAGKYHAEAGFPSSIGCPIACAVSDLFDVPHIHVSETDIEVAEQLYIMTEKATQFVRNFDRGYKIKPFQFTATRV